MPPSSQITREMVVDAALALTRREGAERVNARSVAAELGCSTQPVMRRFPTMAELHRELYARADELHSAYLMDLRGEAGNPLLEIGLRYVRFALEEPNLFRLLFQSGEFAGSSLGELTADERLMPVVGIVAQQAGLPLDLARDVFMAIYLPAHGMASLLANNAMSHDEKLVARILGNAFAGAIHQPKE